MTTMAMVAVLVLTIGASTLGSVATAPPAQALAVDIGGNDTLVFMTPWETQYLDNILVTGIGEIASFKTKTGWFNAMCSEYAYPSGQSALLRPVITPPSGGGGGGGGGNRGGGEEFPLAGF